MKEDFTFDPTCAFGSELWCCHVLGVSRDWLSRNRARLEADGFPRRDALLGRTNKADVQVWIDRRRRHSDGPKAASPAAQPEENHAAL
jgi:hypothetical protein